MARKKGSGPVAPPGQQIRIGARAQKLFDQMQPLFAKYVPESTACGTIGLDPEVWEGMKKRFPGLVRAIKKEYSLAAVALQERVAAGGPGWQAAATLLERRDPAEWARQQALVKRQAPPLQGALHGRSHQKKQKPSAKLVPMPKAGGERG